MNFKGLILFIAICLVFHSCVDQNSARGHAKTSSLDTTSYTITKVLTVSPEKVYNAYVDPQSLKQIWEVDSISVNAIPNGQTWARLRVNEQNWDFTLTYKEVIPNQKLKWVAHFDKHPKIEILTTVVFNSIPEGTEISFSQENFNTKRQRDENKNANTQALNKLSSLLIKL